MNLTIIADGQPAYVPQPDEGITSEWQLLASMLIGLQLHAADNVKSITLHLDLEDADPLALGEQISDLMDYFEPRDH